MKILDFGLAKINVPGQAEVGASSSGEYMTTGGGALGSMPYMSPEQALGKPLDARSDLFSFGVSLLRDGDWQDAIAKSAAPFCINLCGRCRR